jgi:hypothetical protein
MMHAIDAVLDSFSNLFRFLRICYVFTFITGLSLSDLSERLPLTDA